LRIIAVNNLGELAFNKHAIHVFMNVRAADRGAFSGIRPEELVVLEEVARPLIVDHVIQVEIERREHLQVLLVVRGAGWQIFLSMPGACKGQERNGGYERSKYSKFHRLPLPSKRAEVSRAVALRASLPGLPCG
jgi:hypothetical protein